MHLLVSCKNKLSPIFFCYELKGKDTFLLELTFFDIFNYNNYIFILICKNKILLGQPSFLCVYYFPKNVSFMLPF